MPFSALPCPKMAEPYAKTARKWCFTIHLDDLEQMDEIARKFDLSKVKYLVAQPEIAPTTNRPHIQGYMVTKQPVRLSGVKTILDSRTAHVELAKGTPEQVDTQNMLAHAETVLSACDADVSPAALRRIKLLRRIAPTVLRMSPEPRDTAFSSTATSKLRLPDKVPGER